MMMNRRRKSLAVSVAKKRGGVADTAKTAKRKYQQALDPRPQQNKPSAPLNVIDMDDNVIHSVSLAVFDTALGNKIVCTAGETLPFAPGAEQRNEKTANEEDSRNSPQSPKKRQEFTLTDVNGLHDFCFPDGSDQMGAHDTFTDCFPLVVRVKPVVPAQKPPAEEPKTVAAAGKAHTEDAWEDISGDSSDEEGDGSLLGSKNQQSGLFKPTGLDGNRRWKCLRQQRKTAVARLMTPDGVKPQGTFGNPPRSGDRRRSSTVTGFRGVVLSAMAAHKAKLQQARRNSLRSKPPQAPQNALYGYVVYHQQKDKDVERGARQRAVLILTRRPIYYALHSLGRNLIGPLFSDLLKYSLDRQRQLRDQPPGPVKPAEGLLVEDTPMIPALSPQQKAAATTGPLVELEPAADNGQDEDPLAVLTIGSTRDSRSSSQTDSQQATETQNVAPDAALTCVENEKDSVDAQNNASSSSQYTPTDSRGAADRMNPSTSSAPGGDVKTSSFLTVNASPSTSTASATATNAASAPPPQQQQQQPTAKQSSYRDNATVIQQEQEIMASVMDTLYGALTEAMMTMNEYNRDGDALCPEGPTAAPSTEAACGIETPKEKASAGLVTSQEDLGNSSNDSGTATPPSSPAGPTKNPLGPFLCNRTEMNFKDFYRRHSAECFGHVSLQQILQTSNLISASATSVGGTGTGTGVDLLAEMIAADEAKSALPPPCPLQHSDQCASVSLSPSKRSPRLSPSRKRENAASPGPKPPQGAAARGKKAGAVSRTVSLLLPRPQAPLLDQLSYGASLRDIFKMFRKQLCWIHAAVLSLTPVVFVGTTAQQVSNAVLSTVHLLRGLPSLTPEKFVPYATIELMNKVTDALGKRNRSANEQPQFLVLGTTNAFIMHRTFPGMLKVNLPDREIHLPKGEFKLRIPDKYEAFFHSLSQRVAAVSSQDAVPLDPHYTNELELRAELALFNENLTKKYRENRGLMYSVLSHRANIFEKLHVSMTLEKVGGREDTDEFVLVDDDTPSSPKDSPRGTEVSPSPGASASGGATADGDAAGQTATETTEGLDKRKAVAQLLRQRMGQVEDEEVQGSNVTSLVVAAQRYAQNSIRNIQVLERLSQWHGAITAVLSKIAVGSNEKHKMVFEQLFSNFNVASGGTERDDKALVDWSRLVSDDCIADALDVQYRRCYQHVNTLVLECRQRAIMCIDMLSKNNVRHLRSKENQAFCDRFNIKGCEPYHMAGQILLWSGSAKFHVVVVDNNCDDKHDFQGSVYLSRNYLCITKKDSVMGRAKSFGIFPYDLISAIERGFMKGTDGEQPIAIALSYRDWACMVSISLAEKSDGFLDLLRVLNNRQQQLSAALDGVTSDALVSSNTSPLFRREKSDEEDLDLAETVDARMIKLRQQYTPKAVPGSCCPIVPPVGLYTSINVEIVDEVYENQRRYPVLGWSSKLLPTDPSAFSDRSGILPRVKDTQPPVGFVWTSEWQLAANFFEPDEVKYYTEYYENGDTGAASQAQGNGKDGGLWWYGMFFNVDALHFLQSTQHVCRRRRWIRTRRLGGQPAKVENEKPRSPVSQARRRATSAEAAATAEQLVKQTTQEFVKSLEME